MIEVNISGGLGNQMFQYAIGRSISLENNVVLKLNTSELYFDEFRDFSLDAFDIPKSVLKIEHVESLNLIDNVVFKLTKFLYDRKISLTGKIFEIDEFKYSSELMNVQEVSLYGYWQSYKYFEKIRSTLLEDFTLVQSLDQKNKELLDDIENTNSVSIHIRRGDYLKLDMYNTFGIDYYNNAILLMKKKVNNPQFYIFSDDIEWVSSNFEIPNATIVNINSSNKAYLDLELMRNCKHNIIANSSFSWWGAWLNKNEKKEVIAPKKWIKGRDDFSDLLPDKWVKL